MTIPPAILTNDAFGVIDLVQARGPEWAPGLQFAVNTWFGAHKGASDARLMLEPIRERIRTIWMVYPADTAAMA